MSRDTVRAIHFTPQVKEAHKVWAHVFCSLYWCLIDATKGLTGRASAQNHCSPLSFGSKSSYTLRRVLNIESLCPCVTEEQRQESSVKFTTHPPDLDGTSGEIIHRTISLRLKTRIETWSFIFVWVFILEFLTDLRWVEFFPSVELRRGYVD